ncbi:MAG: hypothetical protein J5J06_16295 [Phycisphaerae bacterium]|nr:hypothetical protein [Phycisphaerae bacterium]
MAVRATHDETLPSPSRSAPGGPCEADEQVFLRLTSNELTNEQRDRIREPGVVFPRQADVIAVHWHPEFVPLEIVQARIDAMFPAREHALIIPTQHNVLMEFGEHAGVEVDCFSRGFNRKVQLLVHFERSRIGRADVFKAMLAHTFRYRSQQLLEFIDTILNPTLEGRFARAADNAGADEDVIAFVRDHTRNLKTLYDQYEDRIPAEMVRNKLLMNYFETLRDRFDAHLVHDAERLLRSVKQVVKEYFSPEYFYRTEEIIEEVRSIGGGIVIPHPEQFWPILLAEYDVDGYEVWNPQSQQYTDFLVHVVARMNRSRKHGDRRLLIFMGDDCHLGEKAKDPRFQDPEKAGREIGVQPAWDDLFIRKSLIATNTDRRRVIEEYRARLRE